MLRTLPSVLLSGCSSDRVEKLLSRDSVSLNSSCAYLATLSIGLVREQQETKQERQRGLLPFLQSFLYIEVMEGALTVDRIADGCPPSDTLIVHAL